MVADYDVKVRDVIHEAFYLSLKLLHCIVLFVYVEFSTSFGGDMFSQ